MKFPMHSGLISAITLFTLTSAIRANTTAGVVTDYDPGDISAGATPYQASGAPALGLPATTDGFGTDVTAFSPPFSTADLTQVNAGGHITLHLAAPIGNVSGPEIGVFTNTGIVAAFNPDSGAITGTTSTFSPASHAIVSVSDTGLAGSFVALNGGDAITFANPTSAFTDSVISYDLDFQFVSAGGGTLPTDFFEPFTGTFDQFNGRTYDQMNTLLNGSAGGTWLDISSANLSQVNFIRFDVPAGDNLILDAVTAVPEPSSLGLAIVGLIALARRRQR